MSILQRLLLISASFLLPISVLLYFTVEGIQDRIKFAELEINGNTLQRPLEKILRSLLVHKNAALTVLGGDATALITATKEEASLDSAIRNLETLEKSLGTILQFTQDGLAKRKREEAKIDNFARKWDQCRKFWQTMTPDACKSEHDNLIKIARVMITHLGDTSNLILDPDLDSYYLVDVSLVALPSAQERISNLIFIYTLIVKNGENNQDEKLSLAVQNALFQQTDLDRILASIDTALNEDNNFYGKSESLQKNINLPLERFKKSAGNFGKLLSSLKPEQLNKFDPKILEAGNEALEDSFSFWDICSAELQVLLELRINKFQKDRLFSLALSALALILSFILVWYIGRGLNNSFIQISGNSKKLIVSSNNQKTVSKSMVANATETSAQANAIASAAEEVSVNIQSVASAAEEIGATIREIARQSQQAAQVANDAVSIAETGNKAVLRLGENSNIIGNVIKVITSIAEQTNLLALNASIEAARAGEFGKGFAVVASEVKELAKETAKATEDIRTKIEGIQSDTREAVNSNEKTRNIISKIHEIQSTIAGAVEEQAATTREITRNASDAAMGSSAIAKNISGLAEAARSTSKGATELESAALGLDSMASELEKIVKTFQIKS